LGLVLENCYALDVDKAWRTNLKSLIGNRDTEAVVYHNLKVLLEETDTGKFENR